MPALPAAPGVLRVALTGTFTGADPWLTRLFIHYSGTAPTVAQLTTFDAAVTTSYGAHLKAMAAVNTTLTQVESIDLSSSTGAVDVHAVSVAGTRGSSTLPAEVAAVISYGIGRRYRGGHPRGYWPWGVVGDILSGGFWEPTFLTSAQTAIDAFITDVVAAGWTAAGTLTHVNVSYYSGFTVVTNPTTHRARNVPTLRVSPVIDNVIARQVRSQYGSQRRRTGYID